MIFSACGAETELASEGDSAHEALGLAQNALCASVPLTIATASSSSNELAYTTAAQAIDNDPQTRWSSVFADPQWLQVDLGATRHIDSIVLDWEAASAADYTLELSSDGVTWTTAYAMTGGASGARVDTITNLTSRVARYVRMHGTRRATPWGYSLWELRVNGDVDASCGDTGGGRDIEGRLEAEDHDGMAGVQYEPTSDVDGGQNGGWIEAGDYIEWLVNVPEDGSYTLTTRSATWSPASLEVLVDGAVRSSLALPQTWTGGANQYQTWASFQTPTFELTAGEHLVRVRFTSAGQNLNWIALNAEAAQPSVVEIRTPYVDDFFYLSVNGVRHRLGYWGMDGNAANGWRDISSLFSGGLNDVRVQAMNTGGPGGLDIEIRVDGGAPTRIVCPSAACDPSVESALFIDQPVTLPALDLPPAQPVTITSQHAGKIYVNDEYTGLTSPATIALPPGTFTVGLGVSNDVPGQYSGKYLEKQVTITDGALTVDMESQGEGVSAPEPVRIGLLPIRTVAGTRTQLQGVLTDADIQKALAQFRATSDELLAPFSYGLSSWEVTLLPTVSDRIGNMDYTCGLLEDPEFAPLVDEFDTVAILHSEKDVNGNWLFDGVGGYSIGHCISVPNTAGDHATEDTPQPLFLHEMLHQYEGSQEREHRLFNGAEGLHGAEEHGFGPDAGAETDWLAWYRVFIRGQAGELLGMRPGVHLGAPPVAPSFYTGTFSIVRHGMRTPAPR